VPADSLPRVDRDLVMVAKPNSIALRIAMVGAGEADLLATLRWGREWDIAAAALIAQEGGATVTGALGPAADLQQPRCADVRDPRHHPAIHPAAVERLRERAMALD
jgi:myo-inositol-1(or 4)-monophosphatase